MSTESDLRDALLAYPALVAVVPAARICIDSVEASAQRPYIVFSKQSVSHEFGADNTLLGEITQIDIQCIGSTRSNAISVAALVRAALIAAGSPSDRGSAGYDADNDLEVEVVGVDWIEA